MKVKRLGIAERWFRLFFIGTAFLFLSFSCILDLTRHSSPAFNLELSAPLIHFAQGASPSKVSPRYQRYPTHVEYIYSPNDAPFMSENAPMYSKMLETAKNFHRSTVDVHREGLEFRLGEALGVTLYIRVDRKAVESGLPDFKDEGNGAQLSERMKSHQIVRTVPPGVSPRVGVNQKVWIPIESWMKRARVDVENSGALESTLAFRFRVSGKGKSTETTWLPLVSQSAALETSAFASSSPDSVNEGMLWELLLPNSTESEKTDSGRIDKGKNGGKKGSVGSDEDKNYLSVVSFRWDYQPGLVGVVTGLRIKGTYSKQVPEKLLVTYHWEEVREADTLFTGLSTVSVLTSLCLLFLLVSIVGDYAAGFAVEKLSPWGLKSQSTSRRKVRSHRSRVAKQFEHHVVTVKFHED